MGNVLEKIAKYHKDWVELAEVFDEDYAEDIVQEFYLLLHKYKVKEEQLLQIDSVLDWNAIEEAYKSILKQDSELTDVDIRISLKPAIEQKVAKITAKLY